MFDKFLARSCTDKTPQFQDPIAGLGRRCEQSVGMDAMGACRNAQVTVNAAAWWKSRSVISHPGSGFGLTTWPILGFDGFVPPEAAKSHFEKKFKDKSKNSFSDILSGSPFVKVAGKYEMVEIE